MNSVVRFLLELPLEPRLFALALLGAVAGRWINRGIHRLAFHQRDLSLWGSDPPARRAFADRIPILGWLSLRRESSRQGRRFWVRPMAIEVACAVGLPLLYSWEIDGRLLPGSLLTMLPANEVAIITHSQFFGHAVLIGLMIVATFIDFDERLIPDAITVPGGLAGLAWSALVPTSLLYSALSTRSPLSPPSPLWITTPTAAWPSSLDRELGLLLGLACFGGWCWAIYPKTFTLRAGWPKAIRYLSTSMVRQFTRGYRRFFCRGLVVTWLAGSLALAAVWNSGGAPWQALCTSLVGMAFGGGLIWSLRIVGGAALGREAMGFGDVTLMAMIGAFVGWQGALLVLFFAPFAALIIALAQKLLSGDHAIAFGPYLCLAAVVLLVGWNWVWNQRAAPVFTLGWLIPGILVVCLGLFGGMLWGYQGYRDYLEQRERRDQADKKKRRQKPRK